MKKVMIIMGSDSDLATMQNACQVLDELQLPYEVHVSSAHRTPQRTAELAAGAAEAGFGVIIAGAGGAAHLAGCRLSLVHCPVLTPCWPRCKCRRAYQWPQWQ